MRVMGLDDATHIGWALYDTNKPMSAIVSAQFHLDDKDEFEKHRQLRMTLPKLLREHKPDFVAIEKPKMKTTRFAKVPKKDMLTGVVTKPAEGSEYAGDDHTTSLLNQIYGGVVAIIMGHNIECCPVAANTWQTIIPKSIRGDPKQRVAQFLNSLNIVSPNMNSRDAVAIALWAAGHSQELKLLERAKQGELV